MVLVREQMQTFANFALYVSVKRSNWPLFSQFGHFQRLVVIISVVDKYHLIPTPVFHGGAKPPPKWVMKCPVFWLIFNNFVTFHHFFTKLGNLIWVFVPNNLT